MVLAGAPKGLCPHRHIRQTPSLQLQPTTFPFAGSDLHKTELYLGAVVAATLRREGKRVRKESKCKMRPKVQVAVMSRGVLTTRVERRTGSQEEKDVQKNIVHFFVHPIFI